ncbi:hypothetical protein [Streptomyces sp. NPDC087437]|uniref:hypothetical protein n=1 Tax=Streptomyces sp. NPDC087437 TaxID=3365789 RepID=UPI0037FDDE17
MRKGTAGAAPAQIGTTAAAGASAIGSAADLGREGIGLARDGVGAYGERRHERKMHAAGSGGDGG